MPSHASARKRQRQTLKRTERNKHVRTTVRTLIKRVRESVSQGDPKAAAEALKVAIKRIDQAVTKGIFHHSAGSRYVSRLSHQVAALASGKTAAKSSDKPAKGGAKKSAAKKPAAKKPAAKPAK